MTITISAGSGKGGTGKSMLVANLAVLLAKAGRRVCIVDLDLGGADLHIHYGLFKPTATLSDFLERRVATLSETVLTLDSLYSLQFIAGTGSTLQTANLTFQEKQRLFRALGTIDTDILILDVGAGASYHVLDFFMHAEIQLCVACPDPASIMDFYTFLQLATIRKALSSFLSHSEVTRALKENRFATLSEVFELAEAYRQGSREQTQRALTHFHPLLVVNRVDADSRINLLKLRQLASKYLGIYLPDLGEIPADPAVLEAIRSYLPVCEHAPEAPASQALQRVADKLGKVVDLFASRLEQPGPAATGG